MNMETGTETPITSWRYSTSEALCRCTRWVTQPSWWHSWWDPRKICHFSMWLESPPCSCRWSGATPSPDCPSSYMPLIHSWQSCALSRKLAAGCRGCLLRRRLPTWWRPSLSCSDISRAGLDESSPARSSSAWIWVYALINDLKKSQQIFTWCLLPLINMSISKVSSAREALFTFRMSLPWLKVPVWW